MSITSTRKTTERQVVTRFQVAPFIVYDVSSRRNGEVTEIVVEQSWDEDGDFFMDFKVFGHHVKADGTRRADSRRVWFVPTGDERQMIADWVEENV